MDNIGYVLLTPWFLQGHVLVKLTASVSVILSDMVNRAEHSCWALSCIQQDASWYVSQKVAAFTQVGTSSCESCSSYLSAMQAVLYQDADALMCLQTRPPPGLTPQPEPQQSEASNPFDLLGDN